MKKYIKWLLGLNFCVLILTSCTHTMPQSESSSREDPASISKAGKVSSAPSYSVKKKLDVPIIPQNPELKNGCEVTSLAMLLQYAGVKVDKMTLADEIQKDPTPIEYNEDGSIKSWGNPEKGFVGDITGEQIGYGVYTEPLLNLLDSYLPEQGIDLSHQPFDRLLKSIDTGRPVIVWVTIEFSPPDEYVEWSSQDKIITATFDEHAVLLTGYDKKYCFINNPYTGERNQKVKREIFEEIWDLMGNMAISYI